MRIAQIVHCLDPAHGGPPHVAARLAAALAMQGHEVHLVGARAPSRDEVVRDSLAGVPGIEAVDTHITDLPPGRIGQLLTGHLVRPLRAIGEIDAAHFHGIWGNDVSTAARHLKNTGAVYVARPAGMLDEWTLQQKPLRKKLALRLSTGRMLREAGAIHALNAHEKATIEGLSLGTRLVVIPNGVFVEEVDAPTEHGEFRNQWSQLGNKPFILFLSRLHHKKGLDILAQAWRAFHARLPDWMLVVAGPREDQSIDRFRALIADAGLSGTVLETGGLYGSTKAAALRDCEFFVLPSRQEGFSVAITEAMALGCPVVVTRECHFPEVSEAGAGFETSLDPEEFGGAMIRMAEDEAGRSQAGAAASRLVRSRFVWPEVARQVEHLYKELIKEGA